MKLGVSIKDGKQVAVKIIDKNSIDVKVASLKTEVKILMNVKHPNIVSLLVRASRQMGIVVLACFPRMFSKTMKRFT